MHSRHAQRWVSLVRFVSSPVRTSWLHLGKFSRPWPSLRLCARILQTNPPVGRYNPCRLENRSGQGRLSKGPPIVSASRDGLAARGPRAMEGPFASRPDESGRCCAMPALLRCLSGTLGWRAAGRCEQHRARPPIRVTKASWVRREAVVFL
jgi:hypothetical protein